MFPPRRTRSPRFAASFTGGKIFLLRPIYLSILILMRYILLLLLLPGCGRPESELSVFVAASAEETVRAAGEEFEREEGVRVLVHAGGSIRLRSQILRGAPADVYVAAGPVDLPGNPEVVAVNRMVVVVPADAPDREWRSGGRVALADPAFAPAGVHAARILEREGATSERVYGGHVRAVLAYVELGLVDAGLVYRSDVTSRVRVVESFPDRIEYEAVVVSDRAAARKFLAFLVRRRDLFRKRGFE